MSGAINLLDPGAVPGASTKNRPDEKADRFLMGAKQDRQGRKDRLFARHDTAVIGSNLIVANDNYAPVAVAA